MTSPQKPTLMIVFGTRPEAIKLAPVIKAVEADGSLGILTVVTAQHREMLDQVNDLFGIVPNIDLNLMTQGQTLNGITRSVVGGIGEVLERCKPNAILVQGDTTSVVAAAIAAFNQEIPVIHLEAGLRSGDLTSPFPEEGNRRIVSQIAHFHLAPTQLSSDNLVAEGVPRSRIRVIGNTVIDALRWAVSRPIAFSDSSLACALEGNRRILLVTTHRRENIGNNMADIGRAMRRLALERPDLLIIWPAHKNPEVRFSITPYVDDVDNVLSIEPVGYAEFVHLINTSHIVLTDSGGIQEEAPSLGKPVLVLRENTERPEAVDAGTVKLIGTSTQAIVAEVSKLLDDETAYRDMANAVNPYGDGHSARRAVDILRGLFGS